MNNSQIYAARNYDRGMWLLEKTKLSDLRQRVVQEVSGQTLEIGAGTGANVIHYRQDAVVTAIDLRHASLFTAHEKAARRSIPIDFAAACADAEQLPFQDNTFDTVLGTLVFCSIANPGNALAEIRRVLRPGGRLILLEHVRGQAGFTRALTDWLNPLWVAVQGVCHLDRETAATVESAGFQIDHLYHHARGLIQVISATTLAPTESDK